MIRRVGIALGIITLMALIWFWQLLTYGVSQGYGQLKIVIGAEPIAYYLNNPTFPDSLKSKLRLIEEIRQFAIDSLGLKDTENYKAVYDQKGKELMWVVQACDPFLLEPYVWDFPIVGKVPYKGFFDIEKAKKERDRLKQLGLDVSVRNPGGWSTLGWFKDPILTGMLKRNEGDLASLIIHEMVHATVFVKDDVDFNENLASFIGDTAAYYFLASKYGKLSPEFKKYYQEDQDYRKYSRHILRGTKKLDSLYQSFRSIDSIKIKMQKKEDLIYEIMTSADTLSLFESRLKVTKDRLPNNTYFMSYHLYQSKQENFKTELENNFEGNLKEYIQHLAQKYPFL